MRYFRKNIENILFFLSISASSIIISLVFESCALDIFVRKNILTILIALTAIYIPTLTVILSKLSEMKRISPEFKPVNIVRELKVFVNEIIIFIGISIFIILFSPTKIENENVGVILPKNHTDHK